MQTIPLNPESVKAFKTIMENPKENGFDFKPLKDCFEPADEATPKHFLFKEYVDYIQKPLPKIFFYIIMDELYPEAKAANGDLGYKVKFKPE